MAWSENAINVKTPASGALIALSGETLVGAARLTLVSGFLCTWMLSIISKNAINNMHNKLLPYGGIALAVLVGTPTIALGGSFVASLIQGKTPSEAVTIIAEQVDALFGRVEVLETKQAETDENVEQAQLEIERLRLENENLRLKTDAAYTGTAEIRAKEERLKTCSELDKQVQAKEEVVRAPYQAKMEPLQEKRKELAEKYNLYRAADKPEEFEAVKAELEKVKKEVDDISNDMENAVEAFRATPEVKALIDEMNSLLCA